MKNTLIALALLASSILLSCKKDESSSGSSSSSNQIKDTTGMKVTYINKILLAGNSLDVDINGDLAPEFIFLFSSGSTSTPQLGNRLDMIGTVNNNVLIRTRPAKSIFIHPVSDQTTKQFDPTYQTHFLRSASSIYACSKVANYDYEIVSPNPYMVWLAGASEPLSDNYTFAVPDQIAPVLWQSSFVYQSFEATGDTLNKYSTSMSDCWNQLAIGKDKYVFFKLTQGSTPRLGWLRIRLVDTNTLQIMEAAVQP